MFRFFGRLIRLVFCAFVLLVIAVIVCTSEDGGTGFQRAARPRTNSGDAAASESSNPRSAEEKLAQAITEKIGDSNRDVARISEIRISGDRRGRRVVAVTWTVNDNLTKGMIRKGAILDASKILRAIHESGTGYAIVGVSGTFPIHDEFGNARIEEVVRGTFGRQSIDRINWESFLWENTPAIAESWYVHPALQ